RLAEVLGVACKGVVAALMPEVPASEVQIVCGHVLSAGRNGPRWQALPAVRHRGERHSKRAGAAARDVVLDLEDILHLSLVRVGPEGEPIAGIRELGGDAESLAGPANC